MTGAKSHAWSPVARLPPGTVTVVAVPGPVRLADSDRRRSQPVIDRAGMAIDRASVLKADLMHI